MREKAGERQRSPVQPPRQRGAGEDQSRARRPASGFARDRIVVLGLLKALLFAIAVTAVVGLAACGGGSDEATSTGPSRTATSPTTSISAAHRARPRRTRPWRSRKN